MKKITDSVIILLLVGSSFAGTFIIIFPPQVSAYTLHDPIRIEGDADFAAQAASEGWPGDGTEGNPYIIEGYEIDIDFVNGIDIRSTSVYFIIRNSLLVGSSYRGISFINVINAGIYNCTLKNWMDGIYLESSSGNNISENKVIYTSYCGINVRSSDFNNIARNNVSINDYGIYLTTSHNNNIINNSIFMNHCEGFYILSSRHNNVWKNTVINNGDGIYLQSSDENNITDNNISDNGDYGIYLHYSENATIIGNNISNNENGLYLHYSDDIKIKGNTISSIGYGIRLIFSRSINISTNTMIRCGLGILGDTLDYWHSYDIDTTNTINSKPIYYWKNQTGGIIPPGVGQVILVNCTNIKVKNQELTHGTIGILLGYSLDIYITGNNVSSNSEYGIYFHRSESNDIVDNTISYNGCGILLKSSINNIFHHNNIIDNDEELNCSYHLENVWDDSKGEGNYWSDYLGLDDGSNGRTAGDGVGDTNLPHQGVDYYPLMESVDIEDFNEEEDEEFHLFSEVWFMVLIILSIIIVILILMLLKKRKPSEISSDAHLQENPNQMQDEKSNQNNQNQPKF